MDGTYDIHLLDDSCPIKVMHGDAPVISMSCMHWHNCCEIALLKQGRGTYRLAVGHLEMGPGDIAVFGPQVPHHLITDNASELVQPVILFSETLLPVECRNATDGGSAGLGYRVCADEPISARLTRCLLLIIDELVHARSGYRTIVTALLTEATALLARRLTDGDLDAFPDSRMAKRLSAAADYVVRNSMRELTLAEVAAVVSFSPAYFSAQFHRAYGVTFTNYLTAVRIDRALRMLVSTDQKVISIANECGFGSMANFYSHFERQTRMSPRQVRRKRGPTCPAMKGSATVQTGSGA